MYNLTYSLDIKEVLPSLFEKQSSLIISILADSFAHDFSTVIIDCIYIKQLFRLFEKYLVRLSKRNSQASVTYRYALQQL